MAKELRITFKEKELELYEYIQSKSSSSAFLKNLAEIEMKREKVYIYGSIESKDSYSKKDTAIEYDIDISDLD